MTRRGRIILLSIAVALISGGLGAAILSSRRIEGSIPGRGAVLSLAATQDGLLVGTADGLYLSPDGKRWAKSKRFSSAVLVKTTGERALIGSGITVYSAYRLREISNLHSVPTTLAIVGGSEVRPLVVDRSGRIFGLGETWVPLHGSKVPQGALSLTADDERLYAGGLGIGLWVSEDDGQNWQQALATPVSAIEIDGDRVFLGTPGGLIVSDPARTWRFTNFRFHVDGLAHRDGEFFAVSDRIVYRSDNGDTGWRAIPAAE